MSTPLPLLNASTQPAQRFRIFNRSDVTPRAWYFLCPSHTLRPGRVRSVQIGHQRLAVYRGQSGIVGCVDAFCPHMGTDLALGTVVDDTLRCSFHQWRFAADGACVEVPCAPDHAARVRTRGYPVKERFGALWVWPEADEDPACPLIEIDELSGREVVAWFDTPNRSASPYHVSMVNGLDMQHLSTVHGLQVQMHVDIREERGYFDAVVSGDLQPASAIAALARAFLGPRYAYAMRYAQATVAALELLREGYFRRPGWKWPSLHMLFAYRPLPQGGSLTQPIFLAERRPGVSGWLRARALLLATRVAYRFLEEEDERIYDHIRFSARHLLPIDAAVGRYIRYVERLAPSSWSSPDALREAGDSPEDESC